MVDQRVAFPDVFEAALKLRPSSVYVGSCPVLLTLAYPTVVMPVPIPLDILRTAI